MIGCGDSTAGGIIDCNSGTYLDPACSVTHRCDATTNQCETAKSCNQDSECSGYLCSVSNVCERNCRGQSGRDNSYCAASYSCNGSFACIKGTACTDDTPCGSYACNTGNGVCYASCNGDT